QHNQTHQQQKQLAHIHSSTGKLRKSSAHPTMVRGDFAAPSSPLSALNKWGQPPYFQVGQLTPTSSAI
ncbi:hypothetical protein, partial [Aeromonas veronii]|uniref:hypothetical protein n=1 Tax=Aeromonas veronii TaxID=654 RepID=UPI003D2048A6